MGQSIMRRLVRIGAGGAIVALAMTAWSCGEVSRQGRSPSQIVVMSMDAAVGFKPTQFGNPLESDIFTCIKSGTTTSCAFYNDIGRAEFALVLKDQGAPGITSAPSPLNVVTLTTYHVVYTRSDGRNTPGVDVPYPFDGAMTVTVPATGTVQAAFDLVRNQAKMEAPLIGLLNGGGLTAISTIAEVTFYGADQAGNKVSVVGKIGINFMDFADPAS